MNQYPHSTSTKKLYITYLSLDKNLIKCTIVKFLFKCIFVKRKKPFCSQKGVEKATQKLDKSNHQKASLRSARLKKKENLYRVNRLFNFKGLTKQQRALYAWLIIMVHCAHLHNNITQQKQESISGLVMTRGPS